MVSYIATRNRLGWGGVGWDGCLHNNQVDSTPDKLERVF